MPWFGETTLWAVFPSVAVPPWLQFVPNSKKYVGTPPSVFKLSLLSGADTRIYMSKTTFECSTLTSDTNRQYINETLMKNKGMVVRIKNKKYYFAPVLCGKKVVGVLMGSRPANEEYMPILPKKQPQQNSQQIIAETFEKSA